jgi:hypothetical protein
MRLETPYGVSSALWCIMSSVLGEVSTGLTLTLILTPNLFTYASIISQPVIPHKRLEGEIKAGQLFLLMSLMITAISISEQEKNKTK